MRFFHCQRFSYVALGQEKLDSLATRQAPSTKKIVLHLCLAYIFATAIIWLQCRGNPTSWFFNPSVGYRDIYSAYRTRQADAYIEDIQRTNERQRPSFNDTYHRDAICLGVPTIARNGARYFRTTIGSLLADLDPQERERIYLMPFIAQSDPKQHPAYREEWLTQISNKVLTYDNSDVDLAHVIQLEQALEGYREKALFDYAYMMKACLNTSSPYIAIIEDDVLAMDGWFHRTMKAVSSFEADHENKDLYLRMFYTEQFLGWNVEEWPGYLAASLFCLMLLFFIIMILRRFVPSVEPYTNNKLIGIYCFVYLPLWILLFFASGRISISIRNLTPDGVREMPKYGCCAQGLIYSRELAEKLIPYYETKKFGFADDLTEQYADAMGLKKLALMPSVLQHVGRKSSKYDDGSEKKMSVAETIRSFAFEKYEPVELQREHFGQLVHAHQGSTT